MSKFLPMRQPNAVSAILSRTISVRLVRMKAQIAGLIVGLAMSLAVPLSAAHAQAVMGGSLQEAVGALGGGETLQIIVSFEGTDPLTEAEIAALDGLGLHGVVFQALPMAGVIATKAQIDAIAAIEGVRSVWLNEPVALFNDEARALTGVDRLQADGNLRNYLGLPYSGKGVGIVINDSGIDGTHPDLTFGDKTVQNVMGTTNLNAYSDLLPITYIEGVPDTDIGSGHGTHVAATAAGTGAASGGDHAGTAPGAHLIGYGSGGVLLILDSLGGLDYAAVNQFRYNIRVINNSWGQSGTTDPFNPDSPISIATKILADRSIIVVFAAGNAGAGEGTIGGEFIKAPWVVSAGAGVKNGTLADFSSRGVRGAGGTVTVDGETFEWFDRPTIVAPGVDIVSALANTGVLGFPTIENADYASLQGTSMAAPHTAGVIALMLEANPRLGWREVIKILQDTATNMPGREPWEVGAGYINAYAAVTMAAGLRTDYGLIPNIDRAFNATLRETRIDGPQFDVFFSPVASENGQTFTVPAGLSTVIAEAVVSDNVAGIVLTDPNGVRYGSGIATPLLGENLAVTAPAIPGQWTVSVSGIGSVSGVSLDPLGVTNGLAAPGTVSVNIQYNRIDGFTGLNDIDGHPAQPFIERAVAERLLDSQPGGFYHPDAALLRADLAEFLSMSGAVRQFRRTDGTSVFTDTFAGLGEAAAEATTARGAALRDLRQVQAGIVPVDGATFNADRVVDRANLAYSLVQALGLEAQAEAARQALEETAITADVSGDRIAIDDDGSVPAALRGYVQLALDLRLMTASISTTQGPFDFQPTVHASFNPASPVSRGAYAFSAVNFLDRFGAQE